MPGGPVVVLSSTNVALPVADWTSVLTTNFDGSGDLDTIITANPAAPQEFYIIEGF
ncbi:MAG: hypothetical protein ABSF38_04245 [Verrucomicrobiota bacterium]